MTRTACWSGKLKYFGSDACELVEARAGVSSQQDPVGCGGRGGDHHVVCGSRPSFRHRCYRQARMHPGDAHVLWLGGTARSTRQASVVVADDLFQRPVVGAAP